MAEDNAPMIIDDDDSDSNSNMKISYSNEEMISNSKLHRRKRSNQTVNNNSFNNDYENNSCNNNFKKSSYNRYSAYNYIYLPYIISGYLQLLLNLLMVGFVGYVLISFISSIQHDVAMKVEEYSAEIMNEMALCSRHYRENRCSEPLPAVKMTCQTWETCMQRDPTTVARTKLSAQTLGEIINGFVEPLSYKTMIFCTVFLFGFMIASNIAFQWSRQKMPQPHLNQSYSLIYDEDISPNHRRNNRYGRTMEYY